jgi:hypothetical protein
MLVKKFAKRGKTHTITTIKKVATAVKNSPDTFKKVCANTYKMMTEQAMKLRNLKLKVKLMTIEDMRAHVTPLLNSMQTKGAMYVASADKMLLKYQYTAALRNFGVNFYTSKLAHIVNPMLTKLIGEGKAAPVKAIKPAATRSAPPVRAPAPAPVPQPESEPVMAAEQEEPVVEKAEKKKKIKKASVPTPEPQETFGAEDDAGEM